MSYRDDYEYGPHLRMPKHGVPLFGLPLYPGKPRPGSENYEARLSEWERECNKIDTIERFLSTLLMIGFAGAMVSALFLAGSVLWRLAT